ncbi:MAG: DUF4253 domain-containing protein [bacterium]|nr:DUF4253 domain-containing protein [bacterium]
MKRIISIPEIEWRYAMAFVLLIVLLLGVSIFMDTNTVLTSEEDELVQSLEFSEDVALLFKRKTKSTLEPLYPYSSLQRIAQQINSPQESHPLFEDALKNNPVPRGISAVVDQKHVQSIIEGLRPTLSASGYTVFQSESNFGFVPDAVGIIKTHDQYDILRIHETNGANYDIFTEDIIRVLQEWELRYNLGILIRGADYDWFEADIERFPEDMISFARNVESLCPDVVDQGVGSIGALAQAMERDGILYCWWD